MIQQSPQYKIKKIVHDLSTMDYPLSIIRDTSPQFQKLLQTGLSPFYLP